MLLLGFHGTTKKNLYPKLSNKKWAPPCGWCPFFCFGKICERRCLGSLHCGAGCQAIQRPMADRTLLQTHEAESENFKLRGNHGKCRTRSNLDSCNNRLTADVFTKMFKVTMELFKPRQVHSIESHDLDSNTKRNTGAVA